MAFQNTTEMTFAWTIENFLYRTTNTLLSPLLQIEPLEGTQWRLIFTEENDKSVSFKLQRAEIDDGPDTIEIHFLISTLRVRVSSEFSFQRGSIRNLTILRNASDLESQLSSDGSLTVQCLMCRRGRNVSTDQKSRTHIGVEYYVRVWKIYNPVDCESYNKERLNIFSSLGFPSLSFDLEFYFDDSSERHPIKVRSDTLVPKCHIEGKVCVLDVKGSVIRLAHGKFDFQRLGEKVVNFPLLIETSSLIEDQDLYLKNNELTLLCDFTFSSGDKYHIETIPVKTSGPNPSTRSNCKNVSSQTSASDITSAVAEEGRLANLREDLANLYQDGKLSDVTLRVEDHKFPVHKIILSARSPVFNAMFSNDMLEKSDKEVEISDLDKDTMERLLQYIYSETLQSLDWESAKKLYFAADKYDVLLLRSKCSSFLKPSLSVINVCEALDLSDLHEDQELKTFCQEFINQHAVEVFHSDSWKNFTIVKSALSARTFQNYFAWKTLGEF